MKKKGNKSVQKPEFERPVEQYFYELDQAFTQGNQGLYALFLALAFFGSDECTYFPELAILFYSHSHLFVSEIGTNLVLHSSFLYSHNEFFYRTAGIR